MDASEKVEEEQRQSVEAGTRSRFDAEFLAPSSAFEDRVRARLAAHLTGAVEGSPGMPVPLSNLPWAGSSDFGARLAGIAMAGVGFDAAVSARVAALDGLRGRCAE